MALIVYMILFVFFGRFLKAFSIGVERRTKQIVSKKYMTSKDKHIDKKKFYKGE